MNILELNKYTSVWRHASRISEQKKTPSDKTPDQQNKRGNTYAIKHLIYTTEKWYTKISNLIMFSIVLNLFAHSLSKKYLYKMDKIHK